MDSLGLKGKFFLTLIFAFDFPVDWFLLISIQVFFEPIKHLYEKLMRILLILIGIGWIPTSYSGK